MQSLQIFIHSKVSFQMTKERINSLNLEHPTIGLGPSNINNKITMSRPQWAK